MKRRGFFPALAAVAALPFVKLEAAPNLGANASDGNVLNIKSSRTEKHWVCLNCGEPVGATTTAGSTTTVTSVVRGGEMTSSNKGDIRFNSTGTPAMTIHGSPEHCLNCGASISCTVWKEV